MTEWYQQALTPPRVLQINVRIGVIPEQDHVQGLVELIDPTTGIQIAQASQPHRTLLQLDEVLAWAHGRAKAWLDAEIDPF